MFNNDQFKVTKENGVATVSYEDKKAYESAYVNSGENRDVKTLKEIEAFNKNYLENFAEVATNIATEQFTSDKEVEKIVATAPFTTNANGSTTLVTLRNVESRVPGSDATVSGPRVISQIKNPYSTVGKSFLRKMKTKVADKIAD
jgi:hypothetical protein